MYVVMYVRTAWQSHWSDMSVTLFTYWFVYLAYFSPLPLFADLVSA